MIVPPNNYSEAHFRPDGGNRQCPTQSLSDVSVHESPAGAGPGRRGSGPVSRQASRAAGAVARATRGKPQEGRFWAAFHLPGCFVLFLRICSICLFLSGDDSSAWPNILLNRACGKFPVTEPRVQLTLFQNS